MKPISEIQLVIKVKNQQYIRNTPISILGKSYCNQNAAEFRGQSRRVTVFDCRVARLRKINRRKRWTEFNESIPVGSVKLKLKKKPRKTPEMDSMMAAVPPNRYECVPHCG